MTRSEHPSRTRPRPASTEPTDVPGGDAHRAADVLLTHRTPRRGEVRTVRIGLVAIAFATLVVLNVGIYQAARSRMLENRWSDLALGTDATRDRVRTLFQVTERQLRFLADQPGFSTRARQAVQGMIDEAGDAQLREELDRAAASFGLRHVVLAAPDGRVVAGSSAAGAPDEGVVRSHVTRALAGRVRLACDVHRDADGNVLIEMAIPVRGAFDRDHTPVLLAALDARQVLLPLLGAQVTNGLTASMYLVARSGETIEYLTAPDPSHPEVVPPPVGIRDAAARGIGLAATGVEIHAEVPGHGGGMACITTRYLPELDWGLVGEVDRGMMTSGMRDTLVRLLVLDGLLVALALLVAWLWKRNYERALARQEIVMTGRHAARIQAIFDTAFDAILTFGPDGRVLTANRAAESLFGRAAADMEGQPLQRLLHWGAGPGRTSRADLPMHGVVLVAEGIRADGRVFPAEFSCGMAGGEGDLMYTAIVRDISDRVEAERRIRAFAEGLENSNRRLEEVNAQLEEASRLKSEFLANTSHELRTPLNGIIGFLQLVLDGMCENKEEETDFLKQALQCSRHLLGLINDVLDIAKIEAGKLSIDAERVEVEALFSEVHTVTHVQAQQKGIALRFECPEDTGLSVRCDFAKTKQVLINLIGNALKFTSRGSVTVRARGATGHSHVLFDVVDTGIGIPPDQQKVIFEKFAQGDGSTTRKYGGTGLGLAISRSLVELQGGIIGVHSDGPGKGTRMFFSLPAWQDEHEQPTVIDEQSLPERIQGPAAAPLVLVVEDDPAFRRFVTAVLHHHGYRTVEANHAEAGWALVRRLRPALVVLDYALSCTDGAGIRTGWDLAVRMTTDAATRHIPLVFVTGFDDEVREKLRSTAFSRQPAHLMKPIDADALVARIDQMIGRVQGRQARVLMADDDPSVAAFVRKVLPEDRFTLELASNGEEALHVLRTQPRGFDLLLLDLMMPEVSGYDVLREMTLTGTGAEIPVLVLTNYPDARSAEERRLLNDGLVLDVVAKTAVHDNPMLLAHLLEWHLQVTRDGGGETPDEGDREAA